MILKNLIAFALLFSLNASAQDFVEKGFQKAQVFLEIVKKKDLDKIKAAYVEGSKTYIKKDSLIHYIDEFSKIILQFKSLDSCDWIYNKITLKGSEEMEIVVHDFIFQFPVNADSSHPPQYKVVVTYPEKKDFSKISRFYTERLGSEKITMKEKKGK